MSAGSLTAFVLQGCSVTDSLSDYLALVFPAGTGIEIVDTCGGTLGLNPAVAIFDVTFPADSPAPELTGLASELGVWSSQISLLEFAETHDATAGISAAVLDGKDCLRDLRADADALLFEPSPGMYFRSHDQTVVIMLPDAAPGFGVIFTQGR